MTNDPLQSAYDAKTIMITGAMGYIGGALIRRLGNYKCRLIMASRHGGLGDYVGASTTARIEDFSGDISKPGYWPYALETFEPDLIFHFAAQNSVYVAAQNPVADFAINVAPILNLAEAAQATPKTIDVLYSGTASLIGMAETLPVDPHATPCPITLYDQHKLMAEQYLELFSRLGVLRAVTLRLANVYGPGAGAGSPERGVLNKIIGAALRGQPVSIYGDGNYTRDYIYIDDVLEAFVLAGAHMEDVCGKHYFLGTGQGHLIRDAFTMAARRAAAAGGVGANIGYVPWPQDMSQIERRNFIANSSDFSMATGWRAGVDLAQGIEKTIAALLAEHTP